MKILRLKARRFLLALSFLSRLAPGMAADEDDIIASFAWYPLAGLALALVATLPFGLGLAEGRPLLQGLLFTAFLAWLTRALHWDGWADLFDALGSNRSGADFYAVLKDSRLGAFGCIGLVLGLGAVCVCSAVCLEKGNWSALAAAVAFGRCLVAPLALSVPPAEQSSLGVLACAGASLSALGASLGLILLGGLACVYLLENLDGSQFLIILALALCGLLFLRRVALRNGGMNGDFLGAAIIWGELSVLLTLAAS